MTANSIIFAIVQKKRFSGHHSEQSLSIIFVPLGKKKSKPGMQRMCCTTA